MIILVLIMQCSMVLVQQESVGNVVKVEGRIAHWFQKVLPRCSLVVWLFGCLAVWLSGCLAVCCLLVVGCCLLVVVWFCCCCCCCWCCCWCCCCCCSGRGLEYYPDLLCLVLTRNTDYKYFISLFLLIMSYP